MKTGVVPIADLEFDIDIGLRFAFAETEYDAATVRSWVFEAVDGHTDNVEEKGPCVRVTYADAAGYHVDLVCYAAWTDGYGREQCRLAHKSDGWLEADPRGLLEHVKARRGPFADTKDSATQTDQFRRVVRYLKRWNDEALPRESHGKPTGLAFTLLCCDHLAPRVALWGDSDDRAALAALARGCAGVTGRIVATKPTPQHEDLFGRLTAQEMAELKQRFGVLADALDGAAREPDPVVACQDLRRVFGDDFPVPDPEDTAKKSAAPAIISTSASA
jgi:hypothetical protein